MNFSENEVNSLLNVRELDYVVSSNVPCPNIHCKFVTKEIICIVLIVAASISFIVLEKRSLFS